jgi:hypothetical protein
MSDTRPWYIRPVGDPANGLWLELFSGDDPHIAVCRQNAGRVRIELTEVKALCEELGRGAAQVAIRTAMKNGGK